MRALADIDADLRAAQLRVLELQAEKDIAIKARNKAIFDLFDSGANQKAIARALRVPHSIVCGVIFRSGRSVEGRTAIQAQIRSASKAAESGAGAPT